MLEMFSILKSYDSIPSILSLIFLFLPTNLKEYYFRTKSNISSKLYYNKQNTSNYFENYYNSKNLHEALEFHLD